MALAAVFGCSGLALTAVERAFFSDTNPFGFILFQRNCDNPDQVRALVTDLRQSVGRPEAPVLIDQEGGRVARLQPPHWRRSPAALSFAELAASDPEKAVRAAHLNARLIAADLFDLGITVNCAPVLDVSQDDADPIIGDRAAGPTAVLAALMGGAACTGFLEGGVLPVIKHVPGHGRATVDSHKALPVVEAALEDLQAVDFIPFRALRSMPWAMTAHVVYTAIDPDAPATLSEPVVNGVIRGQIGFDGVLISDDLSMQALGGGFEDRARGTLAAGCDLALHCNGDMGEMQAVAAGCEPLTPQSRYRIEQAEALRRSPVGFDVEAAVAERNRLLSGQE